MNNVALILDQIRRTSDIIASLRERYGFDSRTFALMADPSRQTLLQLQQDLDEATGVVSIEAARSDIWLRFDGPGELSPTAEEPLVARTLSHAFQLLKSAVSLSGQESDLSLHLVAIRPGSLQIGLQITDKYGGLVGDDESRTVVRPIVDALAHVAGNQPAQTELQKLARTLLVPRDSRVAIVEFSSERHNVQLTRFDLSDGRKRAQRRLPKAPQPLSIAGKVVAVEFEKKVAKIRNQQTSELIGFSFISSQTNALLAVCSEPSCVATLRPTRAGKWELVQLG
jgi:hypothetical protein